MDYMRSGVLIGLVLSLSPGGAARGADVEVIEEIVAKVNGAVITRTDISRQRRATIEDLKRRNVPEAKIEEEVRRREPNFLRDRIDQLLLIQRADQLDLKVDQEVSKYMADLMLQYKIADQDKFAQVVREQTGMRYEDFKEEVKNSMLTNQVLSREVGSKVVVPREEILKYYEDHKKEFVREERVFLREILIPLEGKDGDAAAAAEKKAKDLVERARRGEKFEELARDNSAAATAENGGDLGGWKRGDLRKDLEELIWDKERGFVTDPIRLETGFLILKVMAHHQAGLAMFEEVEQEITGRLYGPRFEPKVREYLTQLRTEAYLEIKDGYVDSAAAPGKDTSWTDPARLTPDTISREEVMAKPGRKRLLWLIPIPGTTRSPKSSSK
jgi:parvulin-like peptidyl-prolyl isomerase